MTKLTNIEMLDSYLILGATGMAGSAIYKELRMRGKHVVGLSRNGPDIKLDLLYDQNNLKQIISSLNPRVIINCAAIVSLSHCEDKPEEAKIINSKLVKTLQHICQDMSVRLIHLSSDHFYTGDKKRLHSEMDETIALNVYAKTKLMAEKHALKADNSLVVRTNITGFRPGNTQSTFIEWLINSIQRRTKITLFDDFYASTIDVDSFTKILLNPLMDKSKGIINIGSRDCVSKKTFACAVGNYLGVELNWVMSGSVLGQTPRRAESLGLNCSKIESVLNEAMPDHTIVAHNLVKQFSDLYAPNQNG